MKISARLLVLFVFCTNASAEDVKVPKAQEIVRFTADANTERLPYWKDFEVSKENLIDILETWQITSQEEWKHGFSHPFGGDRTGTISLTSGSDLKWLVRPGGLAQLTYPNGLEVFLVQSSSPRSIETVTANPEFENVRRDYIHLQDKDGHDFDYIERWLVLPVDGRRLRMRWSVPNHPAPIPLYQEYKYDFEVELADPRHKRDLIYCILKITREKETVLDKVWCGR